MLLSSSDKLPSSRHSIAPEDRECVLCWYYSVADGMKDSSRGSFGKRSFCLPENEYKNKKTIKLMNSKAFPCSNGSWKLPGKTPKDLSRHTPKAQNATDINLWIFQWSEKSAVASRTNNCVTGTLACFMSERIIDSSQLITRLENGRGKDWCIK